MDKQNFKTKWNWGAFVNPIGFSCGNRTYLGLLTLVPIFNIIWVFVLGAKGESWALDNRNNNYRDEEEFRKVMDTWKRAGFVQFLIGVGSFIIYLIILSMFFSTLTNLSN
ncbi:ribonuclease G [Lactococcus taiwanensis]|uniref:ribonuclease G n=1 Tax=Lactococcus taiwanensis TaxID=1151742 RepID=UPI00351667A9